MGARLSWGNGCRRSTIKGGPARHRHRGVSRDGGGLLWEASMDKKPDPYYKTGRWLRLRESVLRRDGYMCQVSRRYGKRLQATTVHHVFPREEFPEYQWEPWNLISLAGDVHDQMHDRTTGALSDKGAELLRRIARRNGVEVPGRYRA